MSCIQPGTTTWINVQHWFNFWGEIFTIPVDIFCSSFNICFRLQPCLQPQLHTYGNLLQKEPKGHFKYLSSFSPYSLVPLKLLGEGLEDYHLYHLQHLHLFNKTNVKEFIN